MTIVMQKGSFPLIVNRIAMIFYHIVQPWRVCVCVCVFTRLHFSVDHIGFAGDSLVLYHWSTQQGLVLQALYGRGRSLNRVRLGARLTDQ